MKLLFCFKTRTEQHFACRVTEKGGSKGQAEFTLTTTHILSKKTEEKFQLSAYNEINEL